MLLGGRSGPDGIWPENSKGLAAGGGDERRVNGCSADVSGGAVATHVQTLLQSWLCAMALPILS